MDIDNASTPLNTVGDNTPREEGVTCASSRPRRNFFGVLGRLSSIRGMATWIVSSKSLSSSWIMTAFFSFFEEVFFRAGSFVRMGESTTTKNKVVSIKNEKGIVEISYRQRKEWWALHVYQGQT
jgi:hypothetical protein